MRFVSAVFVYVCVAITAGLLGGEGGTEMCVMMSHSQSLRERRKQDRLVNLKRELMGGRKESEEKYIRKLKIKSPIGQ